MLSGADYTPRAVWFYEARFAVSKLRTITLLSLSAGVGLLCISGTLRSCRAGLGGCRFGSLDREDGPGLGRDYVGGEEVDLVGAAGDSL